MAKVEIDKISIHSWKGKKTAPVGEVTDVTDLMEYKKQGLAVWITFRLLKAGQYSYDVVENDRPALKPGWKGKGKHKWYMGNNIMKMNTCKTYTVLVKEPTTGEVLLRKHFSLKAGKAKCKPAKPCTCALLHKITKTDKKITSDDVSKMKKFNKPCARYLSKHKGEWYSDVFPDCEFKKPKKEPKPVIVRRIDHMKASGLVWDNTVHTPGTYTLDKGTTYTAKVVVENKGDAGKCDVYLYANGKAYSWTGHFDAGERKTFRKNLTLNSDTELSMKVRRSGESEWTDTYGC